ncbi:branched-chain amino acid transport system permease protein [Kibdelosporangium banguiense]|uniref:Branched-chain amino acid transport system permease protein n=1 Tax=Kibdelosporangium banguiense TaxID=1365924 RepID=A0ABS4TVD0_9PSEU|nr:branched-chain amino acid ABC transporter permease [Kibdelosporangium banguiense]MBP2328368.1 branched-chain amino acid transport system permease protein [Kibdelosporangium banguiense]
MGVVLAILGQFGLLGLLTVGVAVIFAATGVVNLAQADLAMVGAYCAATLTGLGFGWRVVAALVLVIPVLLLVEVLLRRPGVDVLAAMLVTWGVGMALRQAAELMFSSTARSVPAPVPGTVDVLGAVYPAYRLVCAGVALAVVGVVVLVAHRTEWGLALRAVADNSDMAAVLGTNPRRLRRAAFAVGGLLAVLAGALYSPLLSVTPTMGFDLLVPVFFGLLLARRGALGTAALAAGLLAALSALLRTWFPDTVAQMLLYAVVVAVAALRSLALIRRSLSWIRHVPAARRPLSAGRQDSASPS